MSIDQAVDKKLNANLDQKTRIKSILGGSAGNLVEWYDWFAYSILPSR